MTKIEDGAQRHVTGGASQPVHITNGADDPVQVNATVTIPPVTATVDFGTAITGEALEAGGAGNLGWLSSIRKKLEAIRALLAAALTVKVQDGAGSALTSATAEPASNVQALNVRPVPGAITATLQSAATGTGNGSALTVTGYAECVFQVSGTFVATVSFEESADSGATWRPLLTTAVGVGLIGTSTTAAGDYRANVAGLSQVRARVTWTSGTSVTVTAYAVQQSGASKVQTLAADLDGNEQSGAWTLNATPGTVTSISIPDAARIVTVIAPSADVQVRLNADPAAIGSGAFAAGTLVKSGTTRAFLLAGGTGRTFRVRSATASATLNVEWRP